MELKVASEDCVHFLHVRESLELIEDDEGAATSFLLQPQREIEESRQGGKPISPRIELEFRADAHCAERQPQPRLDEKVVDAVAKLAPEVFRVRPLEPDRDVSERKGAEEVNENRNHRCLCLRVL